MMVKMDIWLVVEPTPLKNILVSWDDYSQYMGGFNHLEKY